MSVVIQLAINAIIAGAIYALVASSFSLVYNIVKFMDFSLGSIFVAAAFSAYAFSEIIGLNFFVSLALSLALIALIASITNSIVYKRLRKRKSDNFTLLLASFAVFLIINGIILLIFGAEVRTFSLSFNKTYEIYGAIITKMQLILIFASLLLFLLLQFFVKYTNTGKSMRAVADNKEIASTLGINVEKTIMLTFVISYVLAGIAGILVALEQSIEQSSGLSVILKSIIASIVGGIGNVAAALLGGFLVGFVESIGTFFLSSMYKDAITFLLLILFLLFKPNGLLGAKTRDDA